MDFLSLIALATALAMDAFAVALAAGVLLRPLRFRPCFRLVFHFGLFQALMTVLGWLAGLTVRGFISAWSHWLAFALLAFIGGRMMYQALQDDETSTGPSDPSKGLNMVALSIATSIDALAVGLGLAMMRISIWFPALVIGLVAAFFTWVGLFLGTRAAAAWGRWVEVVGGLVLIGIGLKILFSGLVAAPL